MFAVQLSSLPAEIGQLRRLQVLFAYRNRLTEVPETLGACTQLEVQLMMQTLDWRCSHRLITLCCASGTEFGQQPAVLPATCSVQPDPTEKTKSQQQPHRSYPRLCVQHEGSGMKPVLSLSHHKISATSLLFLILLVQVFLHLACNRLENLAENIQSLVELKILIVEGNHLQSLPKALCCLTR